MRRQSCLACDSRNGLGYRCYSVNEPSGSFNIGHPLSVACRGFRPHIESAALHFNSNIALQSDLRQMKGNP